jgi:pimeloyl-ACP methyl ester carboxylesterase
LLPPEAQCGLLSVPLDYGNPGGQQIQLALARVSHTSRHYQGAILVNPGGPGASGLALGGFLATTLQQEGFGAAAAGYDWIGFDPRGVGSSRPAISCIPNYFAANRQSYVPRTPRILSYWLSRSMAYAQACESASPLQAALLRHMTTPDLARDLDSIRQALGQSQISYYGFSYGTYLGQVYATLFPTHLRRLILDSNINPRRIPFRTGNLDQDPAFNRDENIWFGWLARYDRVYGLGATEHAVRTLFYATEGRLRGHPAGGVVGPDEWVDGFIAAGYGQQAWPHLGRVFADWVHRPNVHAAGELISIYRSADTPGNDNSFAVYLSVECTDAPWPTAWSTWARDVSALSVTAPFLAWSNAWFNAPCIFWPAPSHAPVRVNGSGVSSALLIDETLDAATPFRGSLVVRSLFPHSVLLAEPGGTSHATSLTGNLCVDRTIARYLATGTLPPRKAHARWDKACAPLPQPTPSGAARFARGGQVIVMPPGRFWVPVLLAG